MNNVTSLTEALRYAAIILYLVFVWKPNMTFEAPTNTRPFLVTGCDACGDICKHVGFFFFLGFFFGF